VTTSDHGDMPQPEIYH